MLNLLLAIAVAVFIIWLVFTLLGAVGGGLINLLWIVIIACLVVWAFRYFTGARRGPTV